MEMRFAFAVNNNNQFEKSHFGDTEKFLIYDAGSGSLEYIAEEPNVFRDMDEVKEHGSKKKGLAIIDFLKNKGVRVLVSRQFGRNIKIINEHFVPIIIYAAAPEKVINTINHHMHWISDELDSTSSNFKLFSIKSGILKTVVKK